MKPLIIGIAGGTGSGKTTLAKRLVNFFGHKRTVLIDADSYYLDRSHLPLEERHKLNFDHPDALDIPLLVKHIKALKKGKPIRKQFYDFTTHTRTDKAFDINPTELILVDGILIFAVEELWQLFDLKIYLDEDADIRLLRRITRDVKERGRTIESAARQYLETVRPMHRKFVEPSKKRADIILTPGWDVDRAVESIQKIVKIRVKTLQK